MPQYFCGCWQYFIYYIYISNFGGNRIHLNQAILLKYKSNPLLPLPQSAQRFDPHVEHWIQKPFIFQERGQFLFFSILKFCNNFCFIFRQLQVWVVQCTMMSVKIFYRLLCIHFEWLTCWNDSPSSSVVSKLGSSSWQFDKSLMANSLRPPAKFPLLRSPTPTPPPTWGPRSPDPRGRWWCRLWSSDGKCGTGLIWNAETMVACH